MSREALSLDISQVVSRVVRGEPVDPAADGAALAAKYPELGMSAEMIGAAITRAAGMVDRIRAAPEHPVSHSTKLRDAKPLTVNGADLDHDRKPMNGTPPRHAGPAPAGDIDEALAAAIDTEIGAAVSGRSASSTPSTSGADPTTGNSLAGAAVAKLRRAFFRQ